ncbi:MAG: hypothetical protein K8H90_04935, partial [Thermoanaerobaculia bacterium]|nr:hypothetical protein [Thermoanaerobaculia bacterium]
MFQLVIEAAVSGAAIAILALSFQVAYLPSRVFFLGLAGIYALAPYVALEVRSATAALSEGVSWAT